jgi:hypothetical protein
LNTFGNNSITDPHDFSFPFFLTMNSRQIHNEHETPSQKKRAVEAPVFLSTLVDPRIVVVIGLLIGFLTEKLDQ